MKNTKGHQWRESTALRGKLYRGRKEKDDEATGMVIIFNANWDDGSDFFFFF